MNTARGISAIQAATEQHVYHQLEAREKDTVDHFVEHCELWLSKDETMPLLLAIIELDDKRWPFLRADMRVHCPKLAAAFDKIIDHVERHRAEFIECEAEEIIKAAAEGEAK